MSFQIRLHLTLVSWMGSGWGNKWEKCTELFQMVMAVLIWISLHFTFVKIIMNPQEVIFFFLVLCNITILTADLWLYFPQKHAAHWCRWNFILVIWMSKLWTDSTVNIILSTIQKQQLKCLNYFLKVRLKYQNPVTVPRQPSLRPVVMTYWPQYHNTLAFVVLDKIQLQESCWLSNFINMSVKTSRVKKQCV